MNWKRMLCWLLTAALLCACAGLAAAEETPAGTAYVMAGFDDTSMRQWSTNRFFSRMQEKTGVQFTYRQYSDANAWTAYKASLTATSDLPDVFFKASLTPAECIDLLDQGVLIDLTPYLADYAPNLWAILQERPDVKQAITLPGGAIVALPYINTLPAQNYVWINQQWLDQLHLDMPTTAEELVNVLTAFKTRDPNRNGKQDEIPLSFLGPFDLKFLGHAFGLVANDYNVFVDGDQVKFMPLEENYREFVTWCRDLYAEGLLDQNGFSSVDSFRQVTDSNATPTYGAVLNLAASNLFRVSWADQYAVMPPLYYDGAQVYRAFFGPVQRGTFAVTSACKSPETMLSWVDQMYTEEGAILSSAGMENVDYVVDGDGTWRLLEAAQSGGTTFIADTLLEGGASNPGITAAAFMRRFSGQSEMYLKNLDTQIAIQDACVMPFPYVSLTKEQEKTITELQNAIGAYVDIQLARWVLGEEEITDAAFDQFEQTLNELGLPAFLTFWQDVLEQQGGN
ncbi:MAG: extracellular solute-binding protein [Clostridia bacterium]|nr:extracellular solute-binding protein [Clostridia bacterium]